MAFKRHYIEQLPAGVHIQANKITEGTETLKDAKRTAFHYKNTTRLLIKFKMHWKSVNPCVYIYI